MVVWGLVVEEADDSAGLVAVVDAPSVAVARVVVAGVLEAAEVAGAVEVVGEGLDDLQAFSAAEFASALVD